MDIKTFITHFTSSLSSLHWYGKEEIRSMAHLLLQEVAQIPLYKVIVEPERILDEGVAAELMRMTAELATGRPLQYVMGYSYFCGYSFHVSEGVLIPRPETEELVRLIIEEHREKGGGRLSLLEKEYRGNGLNGLPENTNGAGIAGLRNSVNESGKHPLSILDICTGSGCIAWSLAAGLPGNRVYGCDISDIALKIARKQQIVVGESSGESTEGLKESIKEESLQTVPSPRFFKCDVLAEEATVLIQSQLRRGMEWDVAESSDNTKKSSGEASDDVHKLDVIVSNPPYICMEERWQMRPNVLDFEPEMALFVPDTNPLLFYQKITEIAAGLLKKGGKIYFEINERFAGETVKILNDYGFEKCRILPDFNGKERFVSGERASF